MRPATASTPRSPRPLWVAPTPTVRIRDSPAVRSRPRCGQDASHRCAMTAIAHSSTACRSERCSENHHGDTEYTRENETPFLRVSVSVLRVTGRAGSASRDASPVKPAGPYFLTSADAVLQSAPWIHISSAMPNPPITPCPPWSNCASASCVPLLTEFGYRQAERVAEHPATGRDGWSEAASGDPEAGAGPSVAAYGITRPVCSPMRRTLLTAQPASRTLGLQPEIWPDIHEHGGIYLDHGEPAGKVGYPGITPPEVHAQFPGDRAPEGLTESGLVARWLRGMGDLRAPGQGGRPQAAGMNTDDAGIAMVTHGAFASAVIMALVGTPPMRGCISATTTPASPSFTFGPTAGSGCAT